MLDFLTNLLGIRHQLVQDLLTPIFFLFCLLSHLLVLSLKVLLLKNDPPCQVRCRHPLWLTGAGVIQFQSSHILSSSQLSLPSPLHPYPLFLYLLNKILVLIL